jgi:cell division protein FtsI/penicillin-binding protein 2
MINGSAHRLNKRALVAAIGVIAWFLLITGRLVELQLFRHHELKNEAADQNRYLREIWPPRGTITDCQGTILARSLPFPSVFLTRESQEKKEAVLSKLAELETFLPLSPRDKQRIKNRLENGDRFIWIKRKISWELAEKVKKAQIPGIFLQTESKRFYPFGPHLAHVLGGVDIDDQGLSGLEYKYNDLLQGKKGRVLVRRDALKRKYDLEVLEPTLPGKDLILTIDSRIQYIAEKELEEAVLAHQASWGTVVVSRPATGEVLAMASYPDYDPNEFPPADPLAQVNRAIQENFEPGSAFKIVTAAAALEFHPASLSKVYDCSSGYIALGGLSVRDHKRFSLLSFPEVFIHSSNVGTIQVALEIGQENLFSMIKKFRFGEKTGIDLPAEEAGILRPTRYWTIHTLPHIAIGYEISVTALQLLQAMNVIANRGWLVPPRVVQATVGPDGLETIPSAPPVRLLPKETAETLINLIFSKVVEEGTGTEAALSGYPAAGKTGTAQKFDPLQRAYSSFRHRAIFVGFVPSDKPAVSIVVVIDEPKAGKYYGGDVAAPVFREIARRVLLYSGETPREEPKKWVLARTNPGLKNQERP